MNKEPGIITPSNLSRRSFLHRTGGVLGSAALVSALDPARFAHGAASSEELKLALVGCGGRGSGAVLDAMSTLDQGPLKLVAVADVFEDRMKGALGNFQNKHPKNVDVPKDRQFVGFEAYKEAIAAADVVILATPPGFRPMHFEEAIKQGKHVFMEKPVATDAGGVRKVLEAAKEAKKKGLKVGVGLQRHHQKGYVETIKRLQDGAIGDLVTMRAYWNGSTPWVNPRADLEKRAGRKLTEMEYQMRNWYYFAWICGDHICEQHIHNLDVINWVKGFKYPVRAQGLGGAEVRVGVDYGEIFDHHAVEFEYEDGSRCYSYCRHIVNCWNSVSEHVQGTKGRSDINRYVITPKEGDAWRHRDNGDRNPYQQEHADLYDAIRNNKEYNEAENGAMSSMTSILGRMATYSGQMVEMGKFDLDPAMSEEQKKKEKKDKAIWSEISGYPKTFQWDADMPLKPGANGMYPRAVPGQTKVV
jgi:myo-inositol 2-dehydrogenase / D-chiro-inositol 1-dehydrogenase